MSQGHKHKCECGSRVFFDRPISVTCAYGGVIGAKDFKYFECVRCNRAYICSMDPGKKELEVAPQGAALERRLMQLMVDYGYFENREGKIANMVLTDEQDQRDIDRLCLDVKEEALK